MANKRPTTQKTFAAAVKTKPAAKKHKAPAAKVKLYDAKVKLYDFPSPEEHRQAVEAAYDQRVHDDMLAIDRLIRDKLATWFDQDKTLVLDLSAFLVEARMPAATALRAKQWSMSDSNRGERITLHWPTPPAVEPVTTPAPTVPLADPLAAPTLDMPVGLPPVTDPVEEADEPALDPNAV